MNLKNCLHYLHALFEGVATNRETLSTLSVLQNMRMQFKTLLSQQSIIQ